MRTIILTGGGTMGHISPNLALIPKLTEYFDEICYIGSKNSQEEKSISELQKTIPTLSFYAIDSAKFDRVHPLKNLKLPFVIPKATKDAQKIIKAKKPLVVFSKGGYVSIPIVFASHKENIPLVIHESDLSLGLANKVASKYADTVCTTFLETSQKYKNGAYTGSPINQNLFECSQDEIKKKYDLNPNLKTILITGGSLGSTIINNSVFNILPTLVKKYNVLHLTGKGKHIDFNHKNYHQEEFTTKIGSYIKSADIVVTRAGSNTLFELAVLNKPMLIIPLSKKASRGDQIENAKYFSSLEIANVLFEEELNNLENMIEQTIKDIPRLKHNLEKQNFSGGTDKLLIQILKVAKR